MRDIETVKRFDLSSMPAFCALWIHLWSEILILVDVSASGWFKLLERFIVSGKDTGLMSTDVGRMQLERNDAGDGIAKQDSSCWETRA